MYYICDEKIINIYKPLCGNFTYLLSTNYGKQFFNRILYSLILTSQGGNRRCKLPQTVVTLLLPLP